MVSFFSNKRLLFIDSFALFANYFSCAKSIISPDYHTNFVDRPKKISMYIFLSNIWDEKNTFVSVTGTSDTFTAHQK